MASEAKRALQFHIDEISEQQRACVCLCLQPGTGSFWSAHVRLRGDLIGEGAAPSKKDADQIAAQVALRQMAPHNLDTRIVG